jgi:hypothetical protein
MIKKIKNMLKNIKLAIKERFLRNELESMSRGANTLTKKIINLEARIINIERDSEELKVAFGNLTIAYLDIIQGAHTFTKNSSQYEQDDYLEKMLDLFNSKENDDDLPN